jgi:hypothetical protein
MIWQLQKQALNDITFSGIVKSGKMKITVENISEMFEGTKELD